MGEKLVKMTLGTALFGCVDNFNFQENCKVLSKLNFGQKFDFSNSVQEIYWFK